MYGNQPQYSYQQGYQQNPNQGYQQQPNYANNNQNYATYGQKQQQGYSINKEAVATSCLATCCASIAATLCCNCLMSAF